MKHIKEKVADGVLNLGAIPLPQLIQMARETDCEDDLNVLGCEIMYRSVDKT